MREPDLAERMRVSRVNDVFLPGIALPANVLPGHSLETALTGADIVISVMPSHVVRGVYEEMTPWLTPAMLLVSATKEPVQNLSSFLRISQVIALPSSAKAIASQSSPDRVSPRSRRQISDRCRGRF